MKSCSPVEFVQEFIKALNVMGTMLEVFAQEWEATVEAEEALIITFPDCITGDDLGRLRVDIQLALKQAERRGEQKVLAKIATRGGR